jgi:hypothetical protein
MRFLRVNCITGVGMAIDGGIIVSGGMETHGEPETVI